MNCRVAARLLPMLLLVGACKKDPPAPVPAAAIPAAPAPASAWATGPDGALTNDELTSFTQAMCDELTFEVSLLRRATELTKGTAFDLAAMQRAGAESTRLRAEFEAAHPVSPRLKAFKQVTGALFDVVMRGRRVKAHKVDGLATARAQLGEGFTNSVVSREDEVLEKINRCAAEQLGTTAGHRSPAPPKDFGRAAGITLGMSEADVAKTLAGTQTERRPLETSVDVGYNLGPTEGAIARFSGDALESIELVRALDAEAPSVSRAVSSSIASGPLAIKAITFITSKKDPLTLDEVLAKTGRAGQRMRWRLFAQADGAPMTSTTWAWRVEQGPDVLFVVETDGILDQPLVRPLGR